MAKRSRASWEAEHESVLAWVAVHRGVGLDGGYWLSRTKPEMCKAIIAGAADPKMWWPVRVRITPIKPAKKSPLTKSRR